MVFPWAEPSPPLAADAQARALVLWAALAHTGHLRTLAEKATTVIPGGGGLREYGGHVVSPAFLEKIENVDPLKAIARFRQPTLIIHPEKDEHLPLSHPEDFLQAASSAIKEKVIIAGADHSFTSVEWEREVIERTVKWFGKYLLK